MSKEDRQMWKYKEKSEIKDNGNQETAKEKTSSMREIEIERKKKRSKKENRNYEKT